MFNFLKSDMKTHSALRDDRAGGQARWGMETKVFNFKKKIVFWHAKKGRVPFCSSNFLMNIWKIIVVHLAKWFAPFIKPQWWNLDSVFETVGFDQKPTQSIKILEFFGSHSEDQISKQYGRGIKSEN